MNQTHTSSARGRRTRFRPLICLLAVAVLSTVTLPVGAAAQSHGSGTPAEGASARTPETLRMHHETATNSPPGNNGTVKIDGVAFDDHPDNEPHPGCVFQVDLYNFEQGDLQASVTFEAQPPSGSEVILHDEDIFIGQDPAAGGTDLDASVTYDLSDHLAGLEEHEQQGHHIKLTVHAEGSIGADVKHKVFWVQCEGSTPPPPPPGPPTTGDVTLTKDATGDVPSGATFTFAVDCDDDGFDATGIQLTDGQTRTVVDDAPTGTRCTITETDDAGADATSFTVDGTAAGDSRSVDVTVGDGSTIAVLATNDFAPTTVSGATFGLDLLKVDAGDPSNFLKGARFSLFADDGSSAGALDGDDTFEGVCTTDTSGQCGFEGLDPGDYLLIETRAPEGFVAESDDPITVTIVDRTESITVENQPVVVGGVVHERRPSGITLEKTADPITAEVGETITYTYRITNTGETTLSDLALTDDKLGIILLADVVLEPGASTEVEVTYTVTEADAEAGEIVNVATVTGRSPSGGVVRAEDRATVEVVEVAGVTITRPAPAPDQAPNRPPDQAADSLARTGATSMWLLAVALLTMASGVAFLRSADRREERVT